MTVYSQRKNSRHAFIRSSLALVGLFMLALTLSDEISEASYNGFKFSLEVILPSLFPFMVLSDLAAHQFCFEKSNTLSSIFESAFKINGRAISAFLSGMAGGFPVGAKSALELYKNGKISNCECERLMSFANIPSPAYVISAIGIGIFSSYKHGVILYFVCIFSSVICGVLIGINKNYTENNIENVNDSYDFVSSVKKSATASVNLVFFISFFSAVSSLIKASPLPILLKAPMLLLIEITNACGYISELCIYSDRLKLALLGFALSFSGISVLIQSLSIDGGKEMSIQKCILYKLLCGIISFITVLILPFRI